MPWRTRRVVRGSIRCRRACARGRSPSWLATGAMRSSKVSPSASSTIATDGRWRRGRSGRWRRWPGGRSCGSWLVLGVGGGREVREEVVGDRHRCQGADVGAAGVADRVAAGERPGPATSRRSSCPAISRRSWRRMPAASMATWVRTWGSALGWLRMWARSRCRHSAASRRRGFRGVRAGRVGGPGEPECSRPSARVVGFRRGHGPSLPVGRPQGTAETFERPCIGLLPATRVAVERGGFSGGLDRLQRGFHGVGVALGPVRRAGDER